MSRHPSRTPVQLLAIAMATAIVACSSNPEPELEPETSARMAAPAAPVTFGDCVEARRRAAADRELYVDKLPAPKAKETSAISYKSMPESVRSASYNEIRASVLVDTLGHADMHTFAVAKSTNPWLTTSVKSAFTRWTFEPAQLAGCKVARTYHYNLHSGKPH
jgi:hypothetical protein